MYTSANLNKIKNEIQALKCTQPLNGGALTRARAVGTWTGVIDKTDPISAYSLLAAFEATFNRNDGQTKAPLTQFAYSLSPDMPNNARSTSAVIGSTGDNTICKIFLYDSWWPFGVANTGTVTLTVYAYSMVEGYITIKRVYS